MQRIAITISPSPRRSFRRQRRATPHLRKTSRHRWMAAPQWTSARSTMARWTRPASSLAQLVTPSSARPTKLDINLAGFSANETHEISLVRVDADGTMHAAASDISTDAARIVQATGAQSTRWLILVGRPGSGVNCVTVPGAGHHGVGERQP